MINLISKCYYANDGNKLHQTQVSCKGVKKQHDSMSWERYVEALNGSINSVKNTGFRLYIKGIVTYTQDKMGLITYYDN